MDKILDGSISLPTDSTILTAGWGSAAVPGQAQSVANVP